MGRFCWPERPARSTRLLTAEPSGVWEVGFSGLKLSVTGAELILSGTRPLGYGAQFLAAVSGPVANLAAALLAARLAERGGGEVLWVFAGLNLGLAGFNLLPMSQLDGGRALRSLPKFFCLKLWRKG